VLLHDMSSVIPAVLMFIGVSPTCHRYELIVWKTTSFTTIYVQHGYFFGRCSHDHGFGSHVVGSQSVGCN